MYLNFVKKRISFLAVKATMIKKYKQKLNYQLDPDKGSRSTLKTFK